MSNYLAVATITATLQRMLQAIVQQDIEGARITTVRPSDIGNGTPESGVNIFLYQVLTNPSLNNIDSTPMRSRGISTKRQAALDLYYMLTFYGNDTELEPQRLMGSVIRALNEQRIITPDLIRAACRDATSPFLQASNLADQVQQINLLPLDLNLDELSKAWSVFFQTPYLLSIAYKVLLVMIEGEEAPIRSLPIRDRRTIGLSPHFNQPQIDQIRAAGEQPETILVDSTLVITGRQLKGDWGTQVRLGAVTVIPTEVADQRVILPLSLIPPTDLRAGVQSLQIVHLHESGELARQQGKVSNGAPLVLRPHLLSVSLLHVMHEDDRCSGQLRLQTNVIIGAKQRVVMALNTWTIDPAMTFSYLFDALPRSQDDASIEVAFEAIRPGEYLVRLMVDGAESQLTVDNDASSPTYDWYIGPRILIQ